MRRSAGSAREGPAPYDYRYVATAPELRELVGELVACDAYGIDTEFHRERSYYPHLALLQIAWAGGIALVDPLAVDLEPFAEVLTGPGLAILHAASQDLEVLERACGAVPARLFDTQVAAGFLGMSTPSLSTLVERLLERRLEKGDQLTDWTRRPLSAGQLDYAAGDVAYLLELHEIIASRLEERGRLGWAEQECVVLLTRPRGPVHPEEAWWRLKQARQLRGRSRAIAQNVAAWRERKAAALDQPTRFILSDLAIASIAQRPPSSRGELEAVRSIDGRHLAGNGAAELLDAIDAGRRLNPKEVVLPPGNGGEAVLRPAVALAASWLVERSRQLEIDPAILATRSDLVAFLKDPPQGRLADSWRFELIGDPITRLVEGRAAIALDAAGILVLEERSGRPLLFSEPTTPAPEAGGESSLSALLADGDRLEA